MLLGVARGIVQFVTVAVLGGVCLVFGFAPDEFVAAIITNPPEWLIHPLTRIVFMFAGGGFAFLCWRIWKKFRPKMRPQTAASPVEIEVLHALFWIIDLSAWMRWQREHSRAYNKKILSDWTKMSLATTAFQLKLDRGDLRIRARPRNQKRYETIGPDFWKAACLDFQPDKQTLWRISVRGRDGLDPSVTASIPDYSSLQVSEGAVKGHWPMQDDNLDSEILVLSQIA